MCKCNYWFSEKLFLVSMIMYMPKKKQNKSAKTFKIQPLIKGNSYHFSNKFIKKIYLHIKHNHRAHNFVRHIPFKIDPKKHKT